MIKVYISSCFTCGINGLFIRKVKKYAHNNFLDLTVIDSRYSDQYRKEHFALLAEAGMNADRLVPVVVYNGKITRLTEWSL